MGVTNLEVPVESVAEGARPATAEERDAMARVIARFDEAFEAEDCAALLEAFDPNAVVEVKPVGARFSGHELIEQLYRRTLPGLRGSSSRRRKLREWSNQSGVVREWAYPVRHEGEDKLTKQLEVIEFTDGLGAIRTYRLRMNSIYSKVFASALGEDFLSLPGIERIPA